VPANNENRKNGFLFLAQTACVAVLDQKHQTSKTEVSCKIPDLTKKRENILSPILLQRMMVLGGAA
jgi:hypothetical protein